jgi:hypothetical protein
MAKRTLLAECERENEQLRERASRASSRVTALESAAKLAQRWLALYARPNKELSAVTVALQGALAGSADTETVDDDDKSGRDGEVAALREAVQWFVDANTPPNGTCLYCPGRAAHEPWCPIAKVLAVVVAVSVTPTAAVFGAAEPLHIVDRVQQDRELARQLDGERQE